MTKLLKKTMIFLLAGILVFSALPMSAVLPDSMENSGFRVKAQATEIETLSDANVTLHGWLSYSEYGSVPDRFITQNDMYLCYDIVEDYTGLLVNSYGVYDYSVYAVIYRPDGTIQHQYTFDSADSAWISVWLSQAGLWTAEIVVTGDINISVDLSVYVEYDASLETSVNSATLYLSGTNEITIRCSAMGGFPSYLAMAVSYDSEVVQVLEKYWDEQHFYVRLRGLSVGSTDFEFYLYEMYTEDEELVARTSIPITVRSSTSGYTLSYSSSMGTVPSAQTGSSAYYVSSTVPAAFPYTFLGWSKSSTATSASYIPGNYISLSSSTTLYAVWRNPVNLSQNSNYSTVISFPYQAVYYEFTPSYSAAYTFESTGSADSKIAVYDVNGRLIDEDDDGSGNNRNFKLKVNLQADNTYYVKVFLYNDGTGTTSFNVKADTTQYTLTYNGNSGTGVPAAQTVNSSATISSVVPTRFGYSFLGWSTSSTASTASYVPGNSITLSGNTTLYAVWQSATTMSRNTTYTANIAFSSQVKYFKFTPSSTTEYIFESTGSSSDPKIAVYTSSGSTVGEDDDSAGGNNFRLVTRLQSGSTYYVAVRMYSTGTGTTSFSVRESTTSQYTLTYDANSGSNAPDAQTGITSGTSVSYEIPTRFGYTFLGWSTSRSASYASYEPGDDISLTGNTTLYAVWQSAGSLYSLNTNYTTEVDFMNQEVYYTFTPTESTYYLFESTGSGDSQIYLYNSAGSELAKDDDSGTDYNFRLRVMLNAGTTYYVKIRFYADNTGNINFSVTRTDSTSPTVSIEATNNVATSQTVTLTLSDDVGVTSYYWGTSSSPSDSSFVNVTSNTQYTTTKTVSSSGTYYLIARDAAGNESSRLSTVFYKTTLDGNNGSVSPSYVITKSGNSFTLPSATRSGYSLRGWGTSSGASSVAYYSGSSYLPSSSITLYALWEQSTGSYTLTYNANSGSGAPSSQTTSSSVTLSSAIPVRFGYTFLGWSKSSNSASPSYYPGGTITLTGNTTLYAVWQSATSLYTNTTKTVEVKYPYHVTYFTFTPSENGKYCFSSRGSLDSKIWIYNSAGDQIGYDDDTGSGTNFYLEIQLESGRQYYVKIGAYSDYTGSTSFNVTKLSLQIPETYINQSTNVNASSQTITLGMTDNAGVVAYYWGTSSSPSDSAYTRISSTVSTEIRKTVTEPGTYYFIAKNELGYYSDPIELTFVKINFVNTLNNSQSSSILVPEGTYCTLPSLSGTDTSAFLGWSDSQGSSYAEYSADSTFVAYSDKSFYSVWRSSSIATIYIWEYPAKTFYYLGEKFDSTGLELYVEYADGSSGIVTEGFTVSGFSSSSTGTKTVTVSYSGKTTEFYVRVGDRPEFDSRYWVDGNYLYYYVYIYGYEDECSGDISLAYDTSAISYDSIVLCQYGEVFSRDTANIRYTDDDGEYENYTIAVGAHNGNRQLIGFLTSDIAFRANDFLVGCFKFRISDNAADEIDIVIRDESGIMNPFTSTVDLTEDSTVPLLGDIDFDGEVTSADARLALRYAVGLEEFEFEQMIYANMDFDDTISSADARLILRASVELEETERHEFYYNGYDFVCHYCDKSFHFHAYEHYGCYESQRCACGHENGKRAGHIVNTLTRKCDSCGRDLYDLVIKAYDSLNALETIEENRILAENAYARGDYSAFLAYISVVVETYLDIVPELKDDRDFEYVRNDFRSAGLILRETILPLQGKPNLTYDDLRAVKEALDATKEYERRALNSLVEMTEPYEDYIGDIF